MRLFGILLIVFNLLAGGAFVYFATQDWKGRQTINAGGLRHLLLLQGLPLEPPPGAPEGFNAEDETPFVMPIGSESTKTISKKLLESYFTANTGGATPPGGGETPATQLATNAAVTNQIAEVKRVKQLIEAELAKTDLSTEQKITLLKGWLLYQAETYELRLEYLALISPLDAAGQKKLDPQRADDLDKLTKHLEARFNAIVNKPQVVEPTPAPKLPDLKALSGDLKTLRDDIDILLADLNRLVADLQKLRTELKALETGNTPEAEIRAKETEIRAKETEIQMKQGPIQAKQAEITKAQALLVQAVQEHKTQLDKEKTERFAVSQDQTDRRMRLAHLLVHLDQAAAWQKRVMIIVGMRRYVRTVSNQVLRITDMTAHVELGIPGDQAAFIQHETQLREKATQNTERAQAVAGEKAKLTEQKIAEDDKLNRRKTQLTELVTQLNKVKAEVDELLVRQSGIETQLFEVQREVALTLEEVYRLEELLAAVERERYGLPPQP